MDAGAVSIPKIFRRLALDWAGKGNTKLHAFLASEPTADVAIRPTNFSSKGITVAKQYDLADLVLNTGVKFKPGDLVFQEAASTLYDARGGKVGLGSGRVGWSEVQIEGAQLHVDNWVNRAA